MHIPDKRLATEKDNNINNISLQIKYNAVIN